jgi:MinD-like ATPase involved in chromosome partitioning or flagellar assembly
MGKSTISMAIFNSYVSHYQRVNSVDCETQLVNTSRQFGEVPGKKRLTKLDDFQGQNG